MEKKLKYSAPTVDCTDVCPALCVMSGIVDPVSSSIEGDGTDSRKAPRRLFF